MSISASTRRLALALTLALSLAALAAALLGPSQTLAQAHISTCSRAHAKTRCTARVCSQSSHKGRAHRAGRCHARHAGTKKGSKTGANQATTAALCEDGSTPVRAKNGSFSCDDGSEPQCDEGVTPRRSRNGKSLVCPILVEEEPGPGEAECEEGLGSGCGAGTSSAVSEQTCEASASEGSSSLCEREG